MAKSKADNFRFQLQWLVAAPSFMYGC